VIRNASDLDRLDWDQLVCAEEVAECDKNLHRLLGGTADFPVKDPLVFFG
jgi:hypothetical protein